MNAHEVPKMVFGVLKERWAVDTCKETVSDRHNTTIFRAVVADLDGVDCWFSLDEYFAEHPISILRMWPREPQDRDDYLAPSVVFTIRGGPRSDGQWLYGRGNRYVTDVTIAYDRGANGSLLDPRCGLRAAVTSRVLGELFAVLHAETVETEVFYDGLSESP